MPHFIKSGHIATLDERDFPLSSLHAVFLLSEELSSNGIKQSRLPGVGMKMCAGDVRRTQFEAS